jgi:HD-like signal output (HDOD) protein
MILESGLEMNSSVNRILFVDPDNRVLDGHRRLLKALRPSWTARFVGSGRAAMQALNESRVDILVTELNMPVENGVDLLKAVQKSQPEVIRIVLSSEPDSQAETVLRATQSAHRFLVKPCKGEVMLSHIEQAVELRKIIGSHELREIISGIPYLPSLPQLYHDLVAALESESVSVADIGDIIARDVSMTGRVLHLVNSAFFGLPRKISNPREAAVLLGVNVLKSLVLYVKLFFAAPDSGLPGLSLDELWAHSSKTARLGREIARDLGVNARGQEDAFLAGMLHDVGKLLLLDRPGYLRRISLVQAEEDNCPFYAAEYKEFSASHAELGGYLLGLWGLPDQVVEAVACHHRPSRIPGELSPVLVSACVANSLLCRCSDGRAEIDKKLMEIQEVSRMLAKWQALAGRIHADS